jgi:hypothetical protein
MKEREKQGKLAKKMGRKKDNLKEIWKEIWKEKHILKYKEVKKKKVQ